MWRLFRALYHISPTKLPHTHYQHSVFFTYRNIPLNPSSTERFPTDEMEKHKKIQKKPVADTVHTTINVRCKRICTHLFCFFCAVNEPDAATRRIEISKCFKQMHLHGGQELILAVSGIWNIAMAHPNDPEFPYLGVFECMANLIQKGIDDIEWLFSNQNIYIPYYAAHVIGSYTLNKAEFAEKAVRSGVVPPLMGLLRGKISWVEQRVAVRALGHLASYETTFEALAEYEEELVTLAMHLASTCLQVVYDMFVGVKDRAKRLRYHGDLLTRGVGGLEIESRKAEEWASQLQCWSLHLLNCFAYRKRSLRLICRKNFLKDLCSMWGGLVNDESPAGFGLIRVLCYSKIGRKSIAEQKEVIKCLGNLSRSSDDWQYIGIDCLLLLLKERDTRQKVKEMAASFLVDLIELPSLAERPNIGEAIISVLLMEDRQSRFKFMSNEARARSAVEETWAFIERRKQDKVMSEEKTEERRALVSLIKQEANRCFWEGDASEALTKYSEALEVCPLTFRNERMVLYSNRAQCHLLLGDSDATIRDTTRALCLSSPVNSHSKSLWRRSQAYDRKGLAKESLMDCIMFINCCIRSKPTKHVRIPYYAARMISKQMEATWLFSNGNASEPQRSQLRGVCGMDGDGDDCENKQVERMIRLGKLNKNSGLPTIIEDPKYQTSTERASSYRREKAAQTWTL